MTFRGRRRYDPRADERRAREAREHASIERDKARLHRLLRLVRKVLLKGAAADAAWGQKQIRSFTVAKTSDGSHVQVVLRTDGKNLFLQEPSFPSWKFYRLVPKHHVLRREESEDDARDRSRQPIRVIDLHGVAKRAGKKISDFNARALAKGARVELEHTRSLAIAKRIAMDHLTEDPRYYDKLAKMEARPRARRDASKKPSLRKRFAAWHARSMREKREDLVAMGENVLAVTRAVTGGGVAELKKLKSVRTPIGGFRIGGSRDEKRDRYSVIYRIDGVQKTITGFRSSATASAAAHRIAREHGAARVDRTDAFGTLRWLNLQRKRGKIVKVFGP